MGIVTVIAIAVGSRMTEEQMAARARMAAATSAEIIASAEDLPSTEVETAEESSPEETIPESTAAGEIQPITVTNIMNGVHIWSGFSVCESGSEGGRSAAGDDGHAYGILQFDDRYDLYWFLRYCVRTNPTKYAAFLPFIEEETEAEIALTDKTEKAEEETGAETLNETESEAQTEEMQKTASGPASETGNSEEQAETGEETETEEEDSSEEAAIAEKAATEAELSRSESQSLVQAWHEVYDADPAGFTNLQMQCFAKLYYPACVRQCAARGIDINSDTYSPVIRGTLWSISIWAGTGNLQKITDKLTPSMTETEMLDTCYTADTAALKGNTSRFLYRWTEWQPDLARKAYEDWSQGRTISVYIP